MRHFENERQVIAYFADRSKRGQAARDAGEPEVGIFFLFSGEVVTYSTPLAVTEPYGKFNSADSEYDRYWKFGHRSGVVPREIKYNDVPRGRVEYNINEKKFHIYADECIFKDPKAVDEVTSQFRLPAASTGDLEPDPQYRCVGCNGSTKRTKNRTARTDNLKPEQPDI